MVGGGGVGWPRSGGRRAGVRGGGAVSGGIRGGCREIRGRWPGVSEAGTLLRAAASGGHMTCGPASSTRLASTLKPRTGWSGSDSGLSNTGLPSRRPMASAAGTGGGFQGRCPAGSRAGTRWLAQPVPGASGPVPGRICGGCSRGSGAGARRISGPVLGSFRHRHPMASAASAGRRIPRPMPIRFRSRHPTPSAAGAEGGPGPAPEGFRGWRPTTSAAGTRGDSRAGVLWPPPLIPRWIPQPVFGGSRGRCPMAPPPMPRWIPGSASSGFRCPCGQKTDRPVRVVKRSRAATPATELPRSSRPGLQTHRVQRPGTTAMMPPPTPLLPGRPTR